MDAIPEVPDRFWIERSLGTGGFGVVYAAFDRQRHARVALKLLRRADPAGLFRIKHEFRALADLSHPNLVTLHELVADREPWFIAMELVEGHDFLSYVSGSGIGVPASQESTEILSFALQDEETGSTVLAPGPLPKASRLLACDLDRLQRVTPQLVDALVYLHGAGKLHCDVKPSNVLVRRDGQLKLLDFGLAVELGPAPIVDGQPLAGTPAYMSPEQALSETLTPASDWYSVGVMLFEALTGAAAVHGALRRDAARQAQLGRAGAEHARARRARGARSAGAPRSSGGRRRGGRRAPRCRRGFARCGRGRRPNPSRSAVSLPRNVFVGREERNARPRRRGHGRAERAVGGRARPRQLGNGEDVARDALSAAVARARARDRDSRRALLRT